jgi:hypothetical protein
MRFSTKYRDALDYCYTKKTAKKLVSFEIYEAVRNSRKLYYYPPIISRTH